MTLLDIIGASFISDVLAHLTRRYDEYFDDMSAGQANDMINVIIDISDYFDLPRPELRRRSAWAHHTD